MFKYDYSPSTSMPSCAQFFKDTVVEEIISIPCEKPDMERIQKIMVWPEIEDMKLICTEKGISNEGQILTGLKLLVKLRLKQKILYVADRCTQSLHAAHFDNITNLFIIVPECIDGEATCTLFAKGQLRVVPYIETVQYRMLDSRSIHKCVAVFINMEVIK
ncbi:MAG: hypothetical protein ACRCTE_00090 [Cellulosilyticaceae bacterium]